MFLILLIQDHAWVKPLQLPHLCLTISGLVSPSEAYNQVSLSGLGANGYDPIILSSSLLQSCRIIRCQTLSYLLDVADRKLGSPEE